MAKLKITAEQAANDARIALQRAALKRADKALEGQMVGDAEPPPGAYQCNYTLTIVGDIVVGEPTSSTANSFSAGDLLAAVVMGLPEKRRDAAVAKAVKFLKSIAGERDGERGLKDLRKRIDEQTAELAAKHKLTRTSRSAGKVTGEPRVAVNGAADLKGGLSEAA